MGPEVSIVDLSSILVANLTSIVSKESLDTNDGINRVIPKSGNESRFNTITFINISQVSTQTFRNRGSSSSSREESVGLVASWVDGFIFTDLKTPVSPSQGNEGVNVGFQRGTNVVFATSIGHVSSLDDFSSQSDSHGVGNNVDLSNVGIVDNSLSELSKVVDIVPGMGLLVSLVGIARSPGGDVKFGFGVALGDEVLDKVSETSLPSGFFSSVTDSDVGITMDEDPWDVIQGLVGGGTSTEGSSLEIRTNEIVLAVSVGVEPVLEVLSKVGFKTWETDVALGLEMPDLGKGE